MALIETEEAAGRLARVIASDIEIYNRQKIKDGADLSAELEEGYRLFRARVAPSLLPVFESVLSDKGLIAGKTPAPSLVAPRAAAAAPVPIAHEDPPTEPLPAAQARPRPVLQAEPGPVLQAEPRPVLQAEPRPQPEPLPPPDEPSITEEQPTFEAARRLARVIISDIQIYNPKKIANGEDISGEIAEGRALFKARIGADLLPLFEQMLQEKGLIKPPARRAPAPEPAPLPALAARIPAPADLELDRMPTPVGGVETPVPVSRPRLATPEPPLPAVAAEPPRRETPFPLDEPTEAIDSPFAEYQVQRTSTPVHARTAAAALSRVDTPFPGVGPAPMRTPTPFLDGPVMRAPNTPTPVRRGLPPPIPVEAARPLKPVPLPPSMTPAPQPFPLAATPPPSVLPPPAAELPARQSQPRAAVSPLDAPPVLVTTSHRRKPPIRLAAAGAAIVTALGLAYLLFSL